MGRRTWIKIFPDKWLRGTLREENPSVRGIWADVLALAGDSAYGDTGLIQLADHMGFTDEQIMAILHIEKEEWLEAKKRLIRTDRIKILKNNVIKVVNWKNYQSEYERQKRYRSYTRKLQPKVTHESNKEKREERREKRDSNKDIKQSEALLAAFPDDIKPLIKDYIELSKLENKTKVITEGKKLRLITEIADFYKVAGPEYFFEALKITCDKSAPNINYLKKVIKNLRIKALVKSKPKLPGSWGVKFSSERGGDPTHIGEIVKKEE